MRVVIPAAGIGKRLRPHTHTVPKVLLRLAGKPMLGHIMDLLDGFDISEIVFVIGYKSELVKQYLQQNYSQYNLKFIYQQKRLGLGHAIYSTGVSDEDTLIILGDTIFRADLSRVIESGKNSIGVAEVEDPRRFGVVQLDKDGKVSRLVEKPAHPPTNLAVVGVYYLKDYDLLGKALNQIISENIKSSGEYQLTDALQLMVDEGTEFSTFPIVKWLDCGKPETMLETQKVLLNENSQEVNIPGSIIIPPVYVSPNTQVENSVLGPYVDIASGCRIKNCVLSNAIIGEDAVVENAVLQKSIVGNEVVYCLRPVEINLGDGSQIISS
ncbi:MAG: sugar phosphate nucleotidyltransferase [bacterium]